MATRIRSLSTETPPRPNASKGKNAETNPPASFVRSPVERSVAETFEFSPKHTAPLSTQTLPECPDSETIIRPSEMKATPWGLSRRLATTVQGGVPASTPGANIGTATMIASATNVQVRPTRTLCTVPPPRGDQGCGRGPVGLVSPRDRACESAAG